ncbi:helix-turn-helix transcriptional regulator [Bordetella petrii]|uniref:helix-turn-helix transcriptional regulator n=1 Tax=Bordetella petrii TaxID=94624 RepID=UPI0006878CC4|nr:AlpA family phage regulatory protein [Bordetella petrii]
MKLDLPEADEVALPPEAMFDPRPVVMKMTTMSATQLYSAMKHADFPQPYQLGPRRLAWKRTEVLAWLESRPRGVRSRKEQ